MAIPVEDFQIVDSPVGQAMDRYSKMQSNALAQKLYQMQLQEEQAKLPYVGDMQKQALQKAIYENMINKPYAQNANDFAMADLNQKRTSTGLLKAQTNEANIKTALENLKLKYPGLGEPGTIGAVAYATFLTDQPELANKLAPYFPGGQQQTQSSQLTQNDHNIPGYGGVTYIPGKEPSSLPKSLASLVGNQSKNAPQQSNLASPIQMILQDAQSQIDARNALATNRMGLNSNMRYAPVQQKNINALQAQLQNEHPDWDPQFIDQATSAYISGANQIGDQTLPPLSGKAETYRNAIYKASSTAAIQNQAANMDVLANDVNDIDIEPVKRFSQLKGRMDYARYAERMASGQDVPQEFRDYVAFKDVTSNFAMDALRKGFGTSVVPAYVYSTLGKASDPGSSWWYDPKQVETEWNATKDWINKNAKNLKQKANQGATANINNANSEATSPTRRSKYNIETGQFERVE